MALNQHSDLEEPSLPRFSSAQQTSLSLPSDECGALQGSYEGAVACPDFKIFILEVNVRAWASIFLSHVVQKHACIGEMQIFRYGTLLQDMRVHVLSTGKCRRYVSVNVERKTDRKRARAMPESRKVRISESESIGSHTTKF